MSNAEDIKQREESIQRRIRSRNIQIASAIALSLWIVYAGWLLCVLINLQDNQHWISICIVVITSILALAIIIKNAIALFIANDNIFPYSGMPVQMLNKLYEALLLNSQTMLALAFVTIIAVLITEKKIESQAGLPIISIIIGYTVAKDLSKEEKKPEEKKIEEKKPEEKK